MRAANDGVVSFAGSVAGTLHVTVAHAGDLRTSYSFLSSVSVRAGQTVTRGEVVGRSGGVGPDHDGSVLHLGLRVGDRYVDPMILFRPSDLTKLVRLVPAEDPDETPWSAAEERHALQTTLHLPVPGAGAAAVQAAADGGDCGPDVPLVGAALDAVCDVGSWLGDRADEAVDAGVGYLDAVTDLGSGALDDLRTAAHATVGTMRALSEELASALARTPVGQVALDVVAIGRRFADTVTADCSDDSPAADGTGGSLHRVMVVAGINSSGGAGDRGPTVDLDVEALGYHVDEGEVRYFSYAADGGPYTKEATYAPIVVAASRLRDQLRAMQREQPGREVDLIAHSQGGVVVDVFLAHFYRAADPTFPPLGTVVTLSSPHAGAPLATAGHQIRSTPAGRAALDAVGEVSPLPPAGSHAVEDLAEDSRVIRHLWDHGVPEHFEFTTIGATEDVVVPATQISVPGATETVAAVDSINEHSAIVARPGRPPRGASRARRTSAAVHGVGHRAAQRGGTRRDQQDRAHHRHRRSHGIGRSGEMRTRHGTRELLVVVAVVAVVVATASSVAAAPQPVWSQPTRGGPWGIAADRAGVVVITDRPEVEALDRNGRVRWKSDVDSLIEGQPAVGNRRVLVGGRGLVTALSRSTGAELWQHTTNGDVSTVALAGDAALVGDYSGTLTAFAARHGRAALVGAVRRPTLVGAASRPGDGHGGGDVAPHGDAAGAGVRPRDRRAPVGRTDRRPHRQADHPQRRGPAGDRRSRWSCSGRGT